MASTTTGTSRRADGQVLGSDDHHQRPSRGLGRSAFIPAMTPSSRSSSSVSGSAGSGNDTDGSTATAEPARATAHQQHGSGPVEGQHEPGQQRPAQRARSLDPARQGSSPGELIRVLGQRGNQLGLSRTAQGDRRGGEDCEAVGHQGRAVDQDHDRGGADRDGLQDVAERQRRSTPAVGQPATTGATSAAGCEWETGDARA